MKLGARRLLPLWVSVAVGVVACGTSPSVGDSLPSRSAGPGFEVTVGRVGAVDNVLVDGHGWALYLYVPDHHGARSTCYAVCAVLWPPFLLPAGVTKPVAGPGARASLLGTTERVGGATQVTYMGWPLYLFANDTRRGKAQGQDDDMGLWYVVGVGGDPIRSSAA